MEALQWGKTDQVAILVRRRDEGVWYMGSSRITERSEIAFFFNSRDWKGKKSDFWGDLWNWKERCGSDSGRNRHLYQSGHEACRAVGTMEGIGWMCAWQVWAAWVECGATGRGVVLLAVFPSFQGPCQPMALFACFGLKVSWPSPVVYWSLLGFTDDAREGEMEDQTNIRFLS